jgi:hypothetical protein
MEGIGLSYGFHLLAPFPGTEVREQNNKYDLQILTDDWSRYHANRSVVATASVDSNVLDDIVIDWETRFKADVDKIGERIKAGKASKEETEMIASLERMVILYDIMMGDLIETNGAWNAGTDGLSPEEAIDILAGTIEKACDHPKDKILTSLDYVVKQGILVYKNTNKRVQWEWVD